MRLFIAIDLPEKIKKDIKGIQEQLPEFKGKKTEFENLHLTLKFLGEVDEKTFGEIKKRLKGIKMNAFEAEINSIGIFSDRIIWLGINNCLELQKEIDKRLERLFEHEKRFMGHLTIASARNIGDKRIFFGQLKKMKLLKMKFRIDKFILKKSTLTEQKPIYEDMEIFKLEI